MSPRLILTQIDYLPLTILLIAYPFLFYQNTRGLRTQTTEFLKNIIINDFDIIILTETWLTDDFTSSDLFDQNFSVYRKDRIQSYNIPTRGGGTLTASTKEFHVTEHEIYPTNNEAMMIEISLTKYTKIFIGTVYIKPNSAISTHITYFDITEAFLTHHPNQFIISGDFNNPNYFNLQNSLPTLNDTQLTYNSIINFAEFINVTQINYITNKNGNLLDLIFTDKNTKTFSTINSHTGLVAIDNYHPPILLECKYTKNKYRTPDHTDNKNCNTLNENWSFDLK